LVKERVSLQNLLEQFQELNEQFLQQAKVRLEICPSTVILSADAGRLLRVLQNLVGNAADAMAPAGGRILLDVRETDAVVELMIQDEGPGIPEAIREHLFEPFVTHGKRHGTGLGLAIVKATVEAHGGSIRFETALGAGTTFFLQLPRT
jgi:signal transduction histidine kinase